MTYTRLVYLFIFVFNLWDLYPRGIKNNNNNNNNITISKVPQGPNFRCTGRGQVSEKVPSLTEKFQLSYKDTQTGTFETVKVITQKNL